MKRRLTRLPIVSVAVVIGSLLIGLSLGAADAQSLLTNGSVTVRSDGAVYLISNGVRRWVATVVISDEELNAYPEAEPIYSGLAPFGQTTAGPTTPAGTTAAKPTGSPQPAAPSTSGQPTGQTTIDPASGADAKDPNDPTLAEAPTAVDPSGTAQPTGKTTCPDSHLIKGSSDKYYWEPDRADYATVEPVACFRAGKDARDAGYVDVKKRTSTTSR
jgi:hypothetical protein